MTRLRKNTDGADLSDVQGLDNAMSHINLGGARAVFIHADGQHFSNRASSRFLIQPVGQHILDVHSHFNLAWRQFPALSPGY